MAISNSVPLSVIITIVFCFSPPPILSSTSTAAAEAPPLATQICRNTSDFAFCRDAIYSDPLAGRADLNALAYIAFGKAYDNATDTRNYIASKITTGVGGRELEGLKNCLDHYDKAILTLDDIFRDYNLAKYSGLDRMILDVEILARACEKGFDGRGSPLSEKNGNLIELAGICYVVYKLFQ